MFKGHYLKAIPSVSSDFIAGETSLSLFSILSFVLYCFYLHFRSEVEGIVLNAL